jgi:hypothetical protein
VIFTLGKIARPCSSARIRPILVFHVHWDYQEVRRSSERMISLYRVASIADREAKEDVTAARFVAIEVTRARDRRHGPPGEPALGRRVWLSRSVGLSVRIHLDSKRPGARGWLGLFRSWRKSTNR